ncbi:MAG TPA: diacylglycerol kinase family protein [Rhizomicrobium sp.]|jgi:YegS/Rv2252/BmrU family lipid kinase|nr:diacylglycerol kinase family protein [Rhizomicrobium sp.]
MSAFVVVNPRSANGRTRSDWPQIEPALRTIYPDMTVGFTTAPNQATALVRAALQAGHDEIVAIGGDGTINEAINGMFDAQGPLAPTAVFGFVTSGTGGDFRKSFGISSGHAAAIARLAEAPIRAIDIGRVSCVSTSGLSIVRHFANIASFGLSGLIVKSVNRARIAKLFGGQFAFAFHSAAVMLFHRDFPVHLCSGEEFDVTTPISTVAIANGQYFGGGMWVAPGASPDDGLFDTVIVGGVPRVQMLKDMKRLYEGGHINDPNVRIVRAQKITVTPVAETSERPVFIETDGELAGQLPATFEILPRALNVRC